MFYREIFIQNLTTRDIFPAGWPGNNWNLRCPLRPLICPELMSRKWAQTIQVQYPARPIIQIIQIWISADLETDWKTPCLNLFFSQICISLSNRGDKNHKFCALSIASQKKLRSRARKRIMIYICIEYYSLSILSPLGSAAPHLSISAFENRLRET